MSLYIVPRAVRLLGLALGLTIGACEPEQRTSKYVPVEGWPAADAGLGQASGVAVDSHNHVFVFHRASRKWDGPLPDAPIHEATIVMFDGDSGRKLAEWGQDLFIMPHGLSIDSHDNVWVTDVGGQQVREFSHDGELLKTLGKFGEMGEGPGLFGKPTDVAFTSDEDVVISDGYSNSRVVTYTPEGVELHSWGRHGHGSDCFNLPHGVAVTEDGRILVADRTNGRIQVLDQEGRFIDQWKSHAIGWPYGVTVGPDGDVYIIDGGQQPDRTRARVVRLTPDGVVLDSFEAGVPNPKGVLGHDLAVGPDRAVYTVDVWSGMVRKFIRRPDADDAQGG